MASRTGRRECIFPHVDPLFCNKCAIRAFAIPDGVCVVDDLAIRVPGSGVEVSKHFISFEKAVK